MVTKLVSPLKRELSIGKTTYVITVSPDGMRLVSKGKRKGFELAWPDLVSGGAAMAIALRASLWLTEPDRPAVGESGIEKATRARTNNDWGRERRGTE